MLSPIEGTLTAKPLQAPLSGTVRGSNGAPASLAPGATESPQNAAIAELGTLLTSLGTLAAQAQSLPLTPPALPSLPQSTGYQPQATDYTQLADDSN